MFGLLRLPPTETGVTPNPTFAGQNGIELSANGFVTYARPSVCCRAVFCDEGRRLWADFRDRDEESVVAALRNAAHLPRQPRRRSGPPVRMYYFLAHEFDEPDDRLARITHRLGTWHAQDWRVFKDRCFLI